MGINRTLTRKEGLNPFYIGDTDIKVNCFQFFDPKTGRRLLKEPMYTTCFKWPKESDQSNNNPLGFWELGDNIWIRSTHNIDLREDRIQAMLTSKWEVIIYLPLTEFSPQHSSCYTYVNNQYKLIYADVYTIEVKGQLYYFSDITQNVKRPRLLEIEKFEEVIKYEYPELGLLTEDMLIDLDSIGALNIEKFINPKP